MLPWLANDSIIPVTPASVQDYGDATIFDWTNLTEGESIEGCHVEPAATLESMAMQREASTLEVIAYLPSTDPVITALQGFRWRGMVFKVKGDPMPWADPTGFGLDHTVVYGEKAVG